MNNPQTLTVTIEGGAGSGKTILAFALRRFLMEHGFKEIVLHDTLDDAPELLDRPVESISDRRVVIETFQLAKKARRK